MVRELPGKSVCRMPIIKPLNRRFSIRLGIFFVSINLMRKNHIILIVFLILFSVVSGSCATSRDSGYHGRNMVLNKPPKEMKKSTSRYPSERKRNRIKKK